MLPWTKLPVRFTCKPGRFIVPSLVSVPATSVAPGFRMPAALLVIVPGAAPRSMLPVIVPVFDDVRAAGIRDDGGAGRAVHRVHRCARLHGDRVGIAARAAAAHQDAGRRRLRRAGVGAPDHGAAQIDRDVVRPRRNCPCSAPRCRSSPGPDVSITLPAPWVTRTAPPSPQYDAFDALRNCAVLPASTLAVAELQQPRHDAAAAADRLREDAMRVGARRGDVAVHGHRDRVGEGVAACRSCGSVFEAGVAQRERRIAGEAAAAADALRQDTPGARAGRRDAAG